MAVQELVILNQTSVATSNEGLSLEDLIGQLRKSVLRLKADFISEDGSTVNYQAMGNSEAFEEYKKLAGNLKFLDLEALKSQEQERKAFFINLYNVQMIHALVAQENLPDKPLSVQGMWTKYAYNVGGLLFTLDEIEHGVLRCNKGHPKDEKPMFEDEARKSLSLSFLDPRIHFALNCGATSCPPIRVYQKEKLDQQLNMAAKSFVNQEIEVIDDSGTKKVLLTKLLLWYKKDFGQNDNEVLDKLSEFIIDEQLWDNVNHVITNTVCAEKILYRDYNWTINKL